MPCSKQNHQNSIQNSPTSKQNQKMTSTVNYQELYEYERELRINLQKQLEIEKIKVRKLLGGKVKGRICPKCLNDNYEASEFEENLVENFKQFSQKMSSIITKKSNDEQEKNQTKSQIFVSPASIMSQISESVPIIENFTVFGLSEQNIINQQASSEQFGGEILYSLKQISDLQKQAINFIFPSGVAIKKVKGAKAKDKAIEIMSFCSTNLKSFVLSFKSPGMKFPTQAYERNDFLKYVNQQKNLFYICIGIRDYTWVENNKKSMDVSLRFIKEGNSQSPSNSNNIRFEGMTRNEIVNSPVCQKSMQQECQAIALSQRVFCISSYFPFFTFFEEILRSLVNNIKMQRLHLYKLNSQNIQQTIKQTDSKYQLQRISQLFISTISEICQKKMQFNRSYEIKLLNQQKITLLTDWNYAKTFFIDEWIFPILNMFNADTMLDIWTQIILDEGKGVVFICENSHILTYTVYLFGNVLLKPFCYPYAVVNIVPQDEDFLHTPFPVIYGMFKKRKYVEQNQIVERYNDRTYVFLHPQKVDIIYSPHSKKNVQKRKPAKLKNQLSILFKQLKNYRKKQTKSTKYEIETNDYFFLSKLEERQKSLEIVSKINEYIQKQVVKKIPTKVEIQQIYKKIDPAEVPPQKTTESYLLHKITTAIKKVSKDNFLQRFLETQMFSNYLLGQNEQND